MENDDPPQIESETELASRASNERRFSIVKIEGGICVLLGSDYRVVHLPCKYVPFKALKVGNTVSINFRLKHEELKTDMKRFQRHILNTI